MQRLWIVSEFFFPDETATAYILTNIANKLSHKYDIHVIAGPTMSSKPSVSYVDDRITIHRGSCHKLRKDKLLSRTISFIILAIVLSSKLLLRSRRGDKVMIVTNPAFLLPVVSVLKLIKRFELVILTHDLFPENVIAAGIIKSEKSLQYKLLKKLYDRSYARADMIITIGRDMMELMEKKIRSYESNAKVCFISNWADVDVIHHVPAVTSDHIVIQYAGNLGRVQGLKTFLDVFSRTEDNGAVFSLWGKGVMSSTLTGYIKDNCIHRAKVCGPFIRSEENDIISHCDICLISLADGMYGLGVPSKAYNCMAAGKPILYVGPQNSELWRVVSESGIGYCFSPTDEDGLLNFLNSLTVDKRSELLMKGDKAKVLAKNKYAKDIVLEDFFHLV